MLQARTLRYYIGRRFLLMMFGALAVCMTLIFMIDMVELLRQSRNAASITVWQLMWVGFLLGDGVLMPDGAEPKNPPL